MCRLVHLAFAGFHEKEMPVLSSRPQRQDGQFRTCTGEDRQIRPLLLPSSCQTESDRQRTSQPNSSRHSRIQCGEARHIRHSGLDRQPGGQPGTAVFAEQQPRVEPEQFRRLYGSPAARRSGRRTSGKGPHRQDVPLCAIETWRGQLP